MLDRSAFVRVPEVKLSSGILVPSFWVGKYLCCRDEDGNATVASAATPWVNLSYAEAMQACDAVGVKLITERQCLAIAVNIIGQSVNWTGGKVGVGAVFQGLHKGTVASAQPGDFVSEDPEERRWHQLSNGETIIDFSGNVCTWVFDDVRGDSNGLKIGCLANDSPSLTTPPYPSLEKGLSWRPCSGRDWTGDALFRGGCWDDMQHTGVFYLGVVAPDYRHPGIGFRCTLAAMLQPD